MRMSEFIVRPAILPSLAATTKEAVIRAMVESLREAGQFRGADLEDITRAILRRELLGSTLRHRAAHRRKTTRDDASS